MQNNNNIRLDKFLWCIRLFKTRSLSSKICTRKKVKVNDLIAKPSKLLNIDDIIEIDKNHIFYKYKINELINSRVSAKLVSKYILDITPETEIDKIKIRKIYPKVVREKGLGRPTKKERRMLEKNKLIK